MGITKTENMSGYQNIDDFDRILGTPSSQKLINLFVCWDRLSVKEIIEKTGLSETQIYNTLKNLESINVINKKIRGTYELNDLPFTNLLKQAYAENLKYYLGQKLYDLSDRLETSDNRSILNELLDLIANWEPFLKKYFSHKLSTLSGHLIDSMIEE
jgi:predicted DNA-binding protein YlxM (UPF0122 family)